MYGADSLWWWVLGSDTLFHFVQQMPHWIRIWIVGEQLDGWKLA